MKRQQIADWMIRKNIDILCLQETYATAENSNWQLQFPKHSIFHAYGTNHSKGVSIIVKNMPQLQCKKVLQDSNGRYLSMKINYPSITFDLVNLYAPTSSADRKDFYQIVTSQLQNSPRLVVCGDFNCFLNPSMDKLSQAKLGTRSSDTAALHTLLSTLNLTDIYRQCHPDVPGYTWSRSNPPVACRLDMFLTSCVLENKVHEISVLPTAFSDHSCVLLKLLASSTCTRGRGY